MSQAASHDVPALLELVQRLRQRVEQLEQENAQLRQRVAELEELPPRSAAPFRREERRKVPPEQRKKPGRRPGHKGVWRPAPLQIDQRIELPLSCCPRCGGPVRHCRPRRQIIEELPLVRPQVTELITYCGDCPQCGRVYSHHPLQTSHAVGAAGVQLGPRALAWAVLLKQGLGLTARKSCRLLRGLCGLALSPGGLMQSLQRLGRKLEGLYQQLQQSLRASPAVHSDETSWWVGGPSWWLWSFSDPRTTVYCVEPTRAHDVVEQVLGKRYGGMLVSDCLSSYDPLDCRKHKCIAHHLRAIAKARDSPGSQQSGYLREWELLFQTVLTLHRLYRQGQLDAATLAQKRPCLQEWVGRLLEQQVSQPGELRIQHRLGKQRQHLLGCLQEPAAEPTNNRAERSLRPAVIARKLSCGNRTEPGKRCWEILTSLVVTCEQRKQDPVEYLIPHLRLAPQSAR